MSAFNLAATLVHHADRFPDRPCLVWGEETITYAELDRRTAATAGGLTRLGVGQGDVVAALLHNCPEFLEIMFAVARLGGIFMPMNWRLAGDEVAYIAGHAGARLLVSEPELQALAEASRRDAPEMRVVGVGGAAPGWAAFEALRAEGPAPPLAEAAGDDVHRLMYTSGTTARPKGVMITYANLYWKNMAHVVEFGLTGADTGLACGPLYHVGALDLVATTGSTPAAPSRSTARSRPGARWMPSRGGRSPACGWPRPWSTRSWPIPRWRGGISPACGW